MGITSLSYPFKVFYFIYSVLSLKFYQLYSAQVTLYTWYMCPYCYIVVCISWFTYGAINQVYGTRQTLNFKCAFETVVAKTTVVVLLILRKKKLRKKILTFSGMCYCSK